MENHRFKYLETTTTGKLFMLKCLETGGEFVTSLWGNKVPYGYCLCCGEKIKNGKQK